MQQHHLHRRRRIGVPVEVYLIAVPVPEFLLRHRRFVEAQAFGEEHLEVFPGLLVAVVTRHTATLCGV
ncbi:Uncharacterised protein [Mycobacteroides abscessus subsp. massiliense]|nr:Uncharacterised protein [Mycobacteroides abscessus subsp. massiliense]